MLDDCKRRFNIQVGALNLPGSSRRLASLEAIRFDKLTNRRVDHATKIRTAWIIPFTPANFLSSSRDASRFRSVQSSKRRSAYARHRCRCGSTKQDDTG